MSEKTIDIELLDLDNEKTIDIILFDLDVCGIDGINRWATIKVKNLDDFKKIFSGEIEITSNDKIVSAENFRHQDGTKLESNDRKIYKPIIYPYRGNKKNFCDMLIYLHQDTKEYEDTIKLFQERYNKIREEIPTNRSDYLHWVNLFEQKVNSELNKRAKEYGLVKPNSDYIDIFSEDPKVIAEKLKAIKYIETGKQLEKN